MVEERGLPVDSLHFYGAGWQVHLEDLGRSLASDGPAHAGGWSEQTPAPAWHARWTELTPDVPGHAGRLTRSLTREDGDGPSQSPASRSVSVMPGPWPSRMNHSVPNACSKASCGRARKKDCSLIWLA